MLLIAMSQATRSAFTIFKHNVLAEVAFIFYFSPNSFLCSPPPQGGGKHGYFFCKETRNEIGIYFSRIEKAHTLLPSSLQLSSLADRS